MRSIKCKMLIVGDGHIGKSSLLSTYAKRYFPTEYKPTQHQLFSVTPETNTKHPVQLTLVDTAGQEESRGYVAGYLKDSSISLVVVAFDLSFGPTFINARDQWIPLVRQTSPTAPILLVGTKLDVAQKEGWGTELSVIKGLVQDTELVDFIPTSAKTWTEDELDAFYSRVAEIAAGEDPSCKQGRGKRGARGSSKRGQDSGMCKQM